MVREDDDLMVDHGEGNLRTVDLDAAGCEDSHHQKVDRDAQAYDEVKADVHLQVGAVHEVLHVLVTVVVEEDDENLPQAHRAAVGLCRMTLAHQGRPGPDAFVLRP